MLVHLMYEFLPSERVLTSLTNHTVKKNIGVVMGGYSSEYQISLKSGREVCAVISKEKYEVYPLHILKEGWHWVRETGEATPIDRSDFTVLHNGEKVAFDCVVNVIHGTPGEDGFLPAYFDLLNIPYTSCNMYQAALTFNKRDLLATLKPYGIPSARSYYVNRGDEINTKAIEDTVGFPCFVKANKAGSSFGISKVYKTEELYGALEVAFKEDDEVLIESFLEGPEVSVGVITWKGATRVLPITQIITENDFFDYEAKYQGKSQEITPAPLPEDQMEKVRILAKKVYEVLRMKGFSRSEYILVNGEPHLLEVNTIPGMTRESILPQQAKAAGISMEALLDNAIEEALKHHQLRK